MRSRTSVTVTALAIAGICAGTGVADAAPKGAPISFICDNGTDYTGVGNSGNSQVLTWNPAFVTADDGSTALLVPTSIVATVKDPDGNVVFSANATKRGVQGTVSCLASGMNGGYTLSGTFVGNIVPTSH